MRFAKLLVVCCALFLCLLLEADAQVPFFDSFESYASGSLDANLSGGPNQAPNGGPGNPWFGPAPPNLQVVGAGGGLSSGAAGPHSGNQMVTAHFANDFDQDWVNIANRCNGGNALTGNIAFGWWFYDPSGAGDSNYRDYAALGYYNSAAATGGLDYPTSSGGNLNPGGANQRLSLGASNPSGFDNTKYQARVVGATDGLNGGSWFNVGTRSVGWHQGKIVLGAPNGVSTIVSFYLDGVDVLDHAIMTSSGVNVIELNNGFGSTVANYDDVSLSVVPEPGAATLLVCGGIFRLFLRRRK